MEDLDTLLKRLQQQAIEDASRLDPKFKEQVETERAEIAEHEKRLTATREAPKPIPIEQHKPKPDENDVPEKVILERVAKAMIERREL